MRRLAAGLVALCLGIAAAAAFAAPVVVTADLRGGLGPAAAGYLERVLARAAERQAALVVLTLDTPGGLDTSMREMIRAILGSPVPVAVFVAPRGARAASAGTYVLYASHVAAMAPGTNVGAATPVAVGIGGDGERPARERPGADRKADGDAARGDAAIDDPSKAKAMRDAAAYLQSLAQMRGRNAEWARKAVFEADSLPAQEALKLRVIDVVAADVTDLLRQLHGRKLEAGGVERTLDVEGATLEPVAPTAKERLLATIANPNVALLLMMAGIYGLLIEFYVPGTGVPGVVGAIALLLGLYGLALLPINVAGVALLALGLVLAVAEAFAPSFGALGLGGAVAFVAGALLLVDDIPGFEVAWEIVVPLAIANVVVAGVVAAFAVRARRRPSVAGIDAMLGTSAEALEDFEREGWVLAHGERWRARSTGPLRRGERARITGVDGLVVSVEPIDDRKE